VPSYNHEKYIAEAIESILNQSFKDFELIILDDFSKDNSRAIIENYRRKDKRINAYFHRKNMGISYTMNDLLSKASGEFVAFLDSDDLWDKLKLERQLTVLRKNGSLVVWSEGEIIDENSIPTGKTFTQMHFVTKKKKSGSIFEELLYGNFVFGSSLICKADYAKEIQFDEKLMYLNDAKFMVNLAKKHQFFFMKEPLAKYRLHGKNSIFSNKKGWDQDIVIINEYFLRTYGEEIPKRAKASLYFKIAWSYYFLNEKDLAKFFFLKALENYWVIYRLENAFVEGLVVTFERVILEKNRARQQI